MSNTYFDTETEEWADDTDFEDPEVVATYDPSLLEEIDEMIYEYDDDLWFNASRNPDINGDYWVEEKISLDLTDQIDWDSIDYE